MSSVDVAVPAFSDEDQLKPLLGTLNEQSQSLGIRISVIVSDDGSPVPLESLYPAADYPHLQIDFVRGSNGGPGAARNRALASARADWIVFLDSDTVPDDEWFQTLTGILRDTEADGIEGFTRIPRDDRPTPFTHATEIDSRFAHGGANVAYRRDALAQLGGFDEMFYDARRRVHFREDLDLYFRATTEGLRVEDHPELVVTHPPLKASYLTPVRLAKRYYFDPLIARKHPEQFRELNRSRHIGPISFRAARHWAAVGHVASMLIAVGLFTSKSGRRAAPVSAALCLGSWGVNVVALSWGRKMRADDVAPLMGVSLVVPWVYTWSYYRGAFEFRHLPRL